MDYGFSDFEKDIDVSRETSAHLKTYGDLLVKWQKAKNLIANSTLDDIWHRHFLDSAQLAPHLEACYGKKQLTMLDIGSGAGFPGLVLSAMGVGIAHMVEANGRKCIFMRQVIRETGMNADIHNERIENITPFPVDIITSRACASVSQLIKWAAPFLEFSPEIWLLKGETAEEELTEAQAYWTMEIDRYPSRTDAKGVILRLKNIKKA
ncbi:MAG: 16S rRNA (guanine(527)-N(7))-methyltransferase RsmG [Kordiimonadaceae bacterium]|nr:16S rRNA (guanine(527)-N(7))-methyltransferase RsmG [Kordiimonadaceae bacterium]